MAKLKYEFLDQYHRANGVPLRNRVFANINRLSAWGSRMAPLSNLMVSNPVGKMLSQMVLGIHPKRKPPKFVRQTFTKWFKSRQGQNPPKSPFMKGGLETATVVGTDTVVLLNDTYMNYNYPEIGKAAVALLEAAGLKVVLSDTKCCGRPMISKGLLDDATANAVSNIDQLYAYAEHDIPVIGCEPSCLLTFKDEYPQLVRDERANKVAENSYMIDEFLMKLQEDGKLELNLGKLEKKVLFQAHCHQKAEMGTATSMAALRLAPGYQVELINAGCCGMAGSFGYEKEHYDLSMKIGEEALFPAIRAKDEDWEVAVMGVSCRQQVEDGTGRRARHLAEVLADALE
jgi:Fe-S oxidoreductase